MSADAAVRHTLAALQHPGTGIAVQLPLVPNVPAELGTLPAVRVCSELETPWIARSTMPSPRELAAGPLLIVHSDVEVSAEDDASRELPHVLVPVVVSYVAALADAARLLAIARHTQRAVIRSLLLAFPRPIATVGAGALAVSLQRPTPQDITRGKNWEQLGEAAAVLDTVITYRTLDPWAWALDAGPLGLTP